MNINQLATRTWIEDRACVSVTWQHGTTDIDEGTCIMGLLAVFIISLRQVYNPTSCKRLKRKATDCSYPLITSSPAPAARPRSDIGCRLLPRTSALSSKPPVWTPNGQNRDSIDRTSNRKKRAAPRILSFLPSQSIHSLSLDRLAVSADSFLVPSCHFASSNARIDLERHGPERENMMRPKNKYVWHAKHARYPCVVQILVRQTIHIFCDRANMTHLNEEEGLG